MKSISEKLIGLREMERLALKHCLSVLNVIRTEIVKEESVITKRNILMQRKKLIGK